MNGSVIRFLIRFPSLCAGIGGGVMAKTKRSGACGGIMLLVRQITGRIWHCSGCGRGERP